jgi:hypothetical protein
MLAGAIILPAILSDVLFRGWDYEFGRLSTKYCQKCTVRRQIADRCVEEKRFEKI